MTRHQALATALALITMGAAVTGSGQAQGLGAASFLRRGVDARALAMGGAHVAVAEGCSAVYWNPAGLARVPSIELGGTTSDVHAAGIDLNFLSAVVPWSWGASPPSGTDPAGQTTIGIVGDSDLGFEAPTEDAAAGDSSPPSPSLRLAVGMSWTEMSTEVRAYDSLGNPLGLIRYSESVYSLGVGTWDPNSGSVGATVKVYTFVAPRVGVGGGDATAFGIGLDVGVAAPVGRRMWLGIAASDVANTRIYWANTSLEPTDRVAARYTGGAAYRMHRILVEDDKLTVGLDAVSEPLLGIYALKAGVEYGIAFLALRAGVSLRPATAPSFAVGIGVHTRGLKIDGAWLQDTELETAGVGQTIVISAAFRL